jgi:protein-S-isoprenylcysteine O-methyltransferase Ste14
VRILAYQEKNMRLVDDWRRCWRWFSTQAMVLAGALQGAWLFIPEDMKASIPPSIVQWVTVGLLALGVAGRLVKQEKK